MGFCGGLTRIVLAITNFLFLLTGMGVFVVAGLFRWGKDSFLHKMWPNSDVIKPIINVLTVDTITITLLAIGSIIIVVSLLGLCGALLGNKYILGLYVTVMLLVFLGHTISIILISLVWPDAQNNIRVALNRTIEDLNTPSLPADKITLECSTMKIISEVFQCCGANGPDDFKLNTTFVTECCINNSTYIGCSDKTISTIKNDMSIVIISNVALLVAEFLIVAFVFMSIISIARKSRNLDAKQYNNKKMINLTPTTAIYVSGHGPNSSI